MAKQPIAGRVKTRLTPPLSPDEAAAVAEASLADTLAAVVGCGASRRVLALDGNPGQWLPSGFDVIPQCVGCFEERLAAAWDAVDGPALQIGMDTPQITPADLNVVLATLDEADAALGLALDGGWWALAMRRANAAVFSGVPMSAPDTGAIQMKRLVELGLTVADVQPMRDIDDIDDLVAVSRAFPHTLTACVASVVAAST